MEIQNPLIIALDVPNGGEALALVEAIGEGADFYKVGMELYAAGGMPLVSQIRSLGKRIFLDLKLYDIGETVKRATKQISQSGLVDFLTVHGSRTVMEAASEGRSDAATKLLAVTVLTSFDQQDLADLGYSVPIAELVELRVRKAAESQIDGIVCSPLEVRRVREIGGSDLTLVIPGSRSAGAERGDQKRVATPAETIANGADYLVIGRQVTRSADPREACFELLAELRDTKR